LTLPSITEKDLHKSASYWTEVNTTNVIQSKEPEVPMFCA